MQIFICLVHFFYLPYCHLKQKKTTNITVILYIFCPQNISTVDTTQTAAVLRLNVFHNKEILLTEVRVRGGGG